VRGPSAEKVVAGRCPGAPVLSGRLTVTPSGEAAHFPAALAGAMLKM
jgi:hypothetical protein